MGKLGTYQTVKFEHENGVTFVVMNRPEKRNAMSPQLHFDMNDALDDCIMDDDTKVVVLTGAGTAFCAGQDIKEYFRASDKDPKARLKNRRASNGWRWEKLSKFPKPTIAMINGYCFGGAFTQVSACDLAIAADEAVFGLSEVNWGIIPGGIVSWNVVNVLGFRDAMWFSLTGETFTGKQAAEIKFVNRSVPLAELRATTMKLALALKEKSPIAYRFTRDAIRSCRGMSVDQAADYLNAKSDSLKTGDPEQGREKAMKQFLDEKSFKPGLGNFKR